MTNQISANLSKKSFDVGGFNQLMDELFPKHTNQTTGLAVKDVPFEGFDLKAVQSKEDMKVYVGASWICNGIGLTKSQKDTQMQNIQSDIVLKQGCLKFQAGVFDPNNTTVALQIDYLPLWLAKISITPTMQRESPKVVERLISYQLKAKDVLAAAFLPVEYQTGEQQDVLKQMSQKYDQLLEFQQKLLLDSNAVKSDISFIKSQLIKITPQLKVETCENKRNAKAEDRDQIIKVDPIKSAIDPLIEKLNDKSTGGNATYRKVYTAMNVGWANRQTRYRKLHNLKNPPKKITLVESDKKLLSLFIKTANRLLFEVG